MKKIISLVLLLNLCFAIDGKAKEVGFTDSSHKLDLKPVTIDSKVSIEIKSVKETLKCQSLHIPTESELAFTLSSSLSSRGKNANVTIEASEDIVINGNLKASENIKLTLVSKSFVAENACIEVFGRKLFGPFSSPFDRELSFAVKAEHINIIASEILSETIVFGTKLQTKTILFDQTSKIMNILKKVYKPKVVFYAQDIEAHGEISGRARLIEFNVMNSINIDELKVELSSFETININSSSLLTYPFNSFDSNFLKIIYEDSDCNLESISSGGTAYEHTQSSLLSNIERLLSSTYVSIETNKQILINSPLTSTDLLSENKSWLLLKAPYIEVNADIKVNGLLFDSAAVNFSESSLIAKDLLFEGTNALGEVEIPYTQCLHVSNSEIKINSFSRLKTVYHHDSRIECLGVIPEELRLDEYYIHYSEFLSPSFPISDQLLYKYAKKLTIKNTLMREDDVIYLSSNTTDLDVDSSNINISVAGNLNKVHRLSSSTINLVEAIPHGFMINEYYIQSSKYCTLSLSISDDSLYKYAKKLIIKNTMMCEGDVIHLSPNTTDLDVDLSNINISVAGNLNKVHRSSYSTINLVEAMPHGFMINEYCIQGPFKRGSVVPYLSLNDDELCKYAKKLVLKKHFMEEESFCERQRFYSQETEIFNLPTNVKELEVLDRSTVAISDFGSLNRLKCEKSAVICAAAIPAGLDLDIDSYLINISFSPEHKLHAHAKKLILRKINMGEGECFTLPAKVQDLVVVESNIVISNIVNLREIKNIQSSITCIDEIPGDFKLSSYRVLLGSEDRTNFTTVIQDPLIYLAQDFIVEYFKFHEDDKPKETLDFPEFEKPMMESLTFKNCNLNFKKVVAKAITFEESKIRGNYIALSNLTAKKTDFVLGKDNVFDETSIELIDSQVSLTSHIELPSIKAVNCDIDLKDFTMRTKSLVSSGAAAELTSSASPLEDCRFTKDTGKLELIHGSL